MVSLARRVRMCARLGTSCGAHCRSSVWSLHRTNLALTIRVSPTGRSGSEARFSALIATSAPSSTVTTIRLASCSRSSGTASGPMTGQRLAVTSAAESGAGSENVTGSNKSKDDVSLGSSIPDGGCSLESILCTDELVRRPWRLPEGERWRSDENDRREIEKRVCASYEAIILGHRERVTSLQAARVVFSASPVARDGPEAASLSWRTVRQSL
jgi:hypothetical protein